MICILTSKMSEQNYPAQGTAEDYKEQQPAEAEAGAAYSTTTNSTTHVTNSEENANVPVEQKSSTSTKAKAGRMFGSFMKQMDKAGEKISKGIDSAQKKIDETVDQKWTSATLDLMKNGNTVQLVSRSSGRTVQIVMSAAGKLVVDAIGPLDQKAVNTLWMVVNEGQNQVRLHNNNNYLAVVDGLVTVVTATDPGPETKFQLSQSQHFLMLESLSERKSHVGFKNTGELKPAMTTHKEIDSQFGIKLVATAYPDVSAPGTGV